MPESGLPNNDRMRSPIPAGPPDDVTEALPHHDPMTIEITAAQARRIALAAQGFGRPLSAEAGTRQVNGLIRRLGVVQIDKIGRAHV